MNNNPAFHRMVLFDHEKFYLLLSKGGDFISATKCDWITPGSRKLLQNFFDVPSPLVKALKACCEALSVTPCPPQEHMPCILGAGGNGVVFRVTRNDANSTTRCDGTPSETAVQECMALKVIVDDSWGVSVHVHREWEVTKTAGLLSKRVVTVGAIHCEARFGVFLMTEVGTPVETSTVEQRQALFAELHGLHILGITHGDAQFKNMIALPDKIKWIDFVPPVICLEVSVRVSDDFCMLHESLFDQKPSPTQIQAYKQCVQDKVITTLAWTAIAVL